MNDNLFQMRKVSTLQLVKPPKAIDQVKRDIRKVRDFYVRLHRST
jgi:hypothetical protein